jgi:hypothetical protein
MIDPFTAFAAAQAAVAGIQKAIKLGKDVNGLIGEFSRFFDARDAVQKAANDAGKSGKSDTGRAMEIVMQANQLRESEEQLKHMLVYGGYPELWEMMLKERMKIKQARERAERIAEIERKKVSAQRMLMAQIVGGAICIITIGVVIIFIVKQAVS